VKELLGYAIHVAPGTGFAPFSVPASAEKDNAMEELQKTQEYAAERERRRLQQPYEGEERRKRASAEQPVGNPDSTTLPVSGEDGTGRR
jgi:hypothetical protein